MATKGKIQIEIQAKDDASAQMGKIGKSSEAMSATFKKAGLAITAMGVAMAAALTMCVKAAAEEEAGITRLSVAMGNMGIQYDEVRESLEKWINTQQQKTAIADDEQRSSLASLIRVTGDLTKAQDLLSLAMDISVGMNEDLEASTGKLMYALSGNWGMIERYIPALKEAKTEEEKWLMLRQLFVGQAEAYGKTVAGQFQLLKNNIGDIKEAIGSVLLPVLKDLSDKIMPIIEGIKEWIAENPKLTDAIVKFGLVVTGLALVGGPMFLLAGLLPTINTGLHTMTKAFWALKAAAWEVYLLLGAMVYVMLGISAMVKGKWPTFHNIIEEAKFVASYWADILSSMMGMEKAISAVSEAGAPPTPTPTPAPREGEAIPLEEIGTPERPYTLKELLWHIRHPGKPIPAMQRGGIVPGPIGAPMPIIAHGGEQFAGVGKSFGDVHFHIGNFMGDESSQRALVRKFKELMGQDVRRTSFAGINRLEYFPGSSAP